MGARALSRNQIDRLEKAGFIVSTAIRQRVVEERSELHARLGKLKAFLGTARFFALPDAQRRLLEAQSAVMTQYLDILDQRLILMS